MGLFSKLKSGLSKTRNTIINSISGALTGKILIDDTFIENLEEILISADVGVNLSMELAEKVKKNSKVKKNAELYEIINVIKEELLNFISEYSDVSLKTENKKPGVIMICGVNGVGKTTSIGKLTTYFKNDGKKIVLAACDTYRAAAIEQLEIWASRSGVDCIKHQHGSDVGAVVFDALNAAKARNADLLIIDTAGRLHTKINLMEELKKIKKVVQQQLPDAPHETLLVVDATTGQNAISQVQEFHKAIGLTGIILTKMDGTAKGGLVFAMLKELNTPIKFIGVGEKLDDLRVFEPKDFVEALFDYSDFQK